MSSNKVDPELSLLAGSKFATDGGAQLHQIASAPLFTREAANLSGQTFQRGLLGTSVTIHSERDFPTAPNDPRLYLNLNAPTSGLVCGVQGSGKSHTVSCILESALIKDERIGSLSTSVSSIVFHYDEEGSGKPSEAAFVTQPQTENGAAVQDAIILVSSSNLTNMKKAYSDTPNVKIKPFYIHQDHLSAARMLSLMGCQDIERMPLYLHSVLSILRRIGAKEFDYKEFKKDLKEQKWDFKQNAMLNLRLNLLDSYLTEEPNDFTRYLKPGRMIILDLTDPFLDSNTANTLFNIGLGMFMESKELSDKLIVVDEAHKYLNPNADAPPSQFVKSLCSIIRQQRHLGTRVVIATQEPTIIPSSVLSLLSWIVCHRFQSPTWAEFMSRYVVRIGDSKHSNGNDALNQDDWRERVIALNTGEALLFSPGTLAVARNGKLKTLGKAYMTIRTRPRVTSDGGASIFAVSIQEIKPQELSSLQGLSLANHDPQTLNSGSSKATHPASSPLREADLWNTFEDDGEELFKTLELAKVGSSKAKSTRALSPIPGLEPTSGSRPSGVKMDRVVYPLPTRGLKAEKVAA